MAQKVFTIISENGIHAEPAAELINKAGQYGSEVTLEHNGRSVNLKSIMGVMSLGISQGANVTIKTEGPDEDKALKEICKVLKKDLGK